MVGTKHNRLALLFAVLSTLIVLFLSGAVSYADEPEYITLTLKWSSVDGAQPVEDYKVQVEKGKSYYQGVYRDSSKRSAINSHFSSDGYGSYGLVTPAPISSYENTEEASSANYNTNRNTTQLDADTTLYFLMYKDVTKVSLEVERPKCGTVVESEIIDEWWENYVQTNAPELTFDEDCELTLNTEGSYSGAAWCDDEYIPLNTELTGGESYLAVVDVSAAFGYAINTDAMPDITVTNADEGSVELTSDFFFGDRLFFTVTAEHEWDDGTVSKEPGCEETGTRLYKCVHDSSHTKEEEIAALGHDFGEWEMTRKPTCAAEGEEERICKRNSAHKETRKVKIDPEAHSWDGGVVTKEPTADAEGVKTFTCKHCGKKRTEPLPKKEPAPEPAPDQESGKDTKSKETLKKYVKKVATRASMKKKTMLVKWRKVKGAANYMIAYRLAGKKWSRKWTGGKNKIVLKKMKKGGLYQFKVMAVRKSGSALIKSKWSKVNYRLFLNTTEKLKAARKGVRVTLEKVRKSSGYDAQYDFKEPVKESKIKTVKGASKTRFKVSGLDGSRTYYLRTRPYKTYKAHRYIGIWNGPKKVKTI